MTTTRPSVLTAIRDAIRSDVAARTGDLVIVHDDRRAFLVTARHLQCLGCGRRLVPRYAGGMRRWTASKRAWVERHLGHRAPREASAGAGPVKPPGA